MTNSTWMVVLEVVRRSRASPVDAGMVKRLLELLCEAEPEGAQPIALLADDRYALHLSVSADHVAEAIVIAMFRWDNVSKRLGLEGWDARRAEVMLRADFEAETQPLAGRGWQLRDH